MLRNSPLVSIVMVLLLAGAWEVATYFEMLPAYILPSPVLVLRVYEESFGDILAACGNTLCTALLGFCISILFGLTVGFLIYESKSLRRVLLPLFVAIKSTPIIAIVPIVSLFLKVGVITKVALALTACFFPMVISTYTGLAKVSVGLFDFASSMSASRYRYFFFVSLPSAANELGLGVKITLPLAFIGAVVAEMAGGDDAGIGYMVLSASYRLDSPRLYASVLALMAVSSTSYLLLTSIIARLNPEYRD